MDVVIPYTYKVQKTKNGKVVQVTTSAAEAERSLSPGYRVEIWLKGELLDTVYSRTRDKLEQYKPPDILTHNRAIVSAMRTLDTARSSLTAQQYRTLKGQILAGSADCALKGLQKIERRALRGLET